MPSYTRNLPHLTPEEIATRDGEESRLNSALGKCWRGNSFDHERASHVIPGYAVEMFDVVYAAYRKKTGYKVEWISEIVKEVIYRTFLVYDGFNTYGKPSMEELSKTLSSVLHSHFQNSPKYAPPRLLPPDKNPIPVPALTGKQASAYARAGIDLASAGPLVLMLHEQANRTDEQHPQARPATPKLPKSIGEQIKAYMLEARLTKDKVATALGVDPRTVARHRSGEAIPRLGQVSGYETLFSKALKRTIHLETP